MRAGLNHNGGAFLGFFILVCVCALPASAQVPIPPIPTGNWYRSGATLDLDFVHDQYYLNGTSYTDAGASIGTALANFISGAGATFTRAGTSNVTTTSPPSFSPFFLPSVDSFVSRADSTPIATYFNSSGTLTTVATAGAGRTAAYYYNGSSWVLGGTLAEPAATNILLYSASATSPNYGSDATATNAATTAPDGTTTGIRVVEDTSTTQHTYSQIISVTPYSPYTYSVFVKSYTGDRSVQLIQWDATDGNFGGQLVFNPTTQTLTSGSGNYTVTNYPNGWSRISITGIATVSSIVVNIKLYNGSYSYTGNGSSGVYVWGEQLEAGSTPTSYIATTSAAVTRAADVYSVPEGGTYFNSGGVLTQAAVSTPRLDYGSSGGSNPQGILIEESRTNSIPNNMMVGAVAADGVQRTNNGSFSNTSPNVCTGSVTSSTNTLSCYNGTGTGWVGTINGSSSATISASAGQMTLTGDGTKAASVYEALTTASGHAYNVSVTNGAGNPVTVQVGTSAGDASLLAASSIAASTSTSYQFTASGTTSYVQINNTSATAANVTTVSAQSAGLLPTGWTFSYDNNPTIVYSVVGTGVQNGINYTDVNFSGTAVAAGAAFTFLFTPNGSSGIAASNNQTWDESAYIAMSGGSFPSGGSLVPGWYVYNGGSLLQSQQLSPSISGSSLTSTLTPYNWSGTIAQSTATDLEPYVFLDAASAGAINVTLRIGMPQMELGAFPTSVIPTYGSAVTRAADVFTIGTSAAGANGAWYTAGQGTLGASGIYPYLDPAEFPGLADLYVSNGNSISLYQNGSSTEVSTIYNGGITQFSTNSGSHYYTAGNLSQEVIAFSSGSANAAFDGLLGTGTTTVTIPAVTHLDVGEDADTPQGIRWVDRIWYMPTRQPDASLPGYTN